MASTVTKGSTNWEVSLENIAMSNATGTGSSILLSTKDKYIDRDIAILAPTATMTESQIGVAGSNPTDADYIENTTAKISSNGYLTLSAGYMPKTKISLATLIADNANITPVNSTASDKMLSGTSAYDNDGNLLVGTIPYKTSSNSSASGKTVTWDSGYYSTGGSKSVADGTINTSHLVTTNTGITAVTKAGWIGSTLYVSTGSASASGTGGTSTLSSLTFAHTTGTHPNTGDTTHTFKVSGSKTVNSTVNTNFTEGWISSISGGGASVTSTVTVNATVDEIQIGAGITGNQSMTPTVSTASVPSSVTNAAKGGATTTAPSSGVYVAVNTDSDSKKVIATPNVAKDGYGTTSYYYYSTSGSTVSMNQSGVTYVPIKTVGSATLNVTDKTITPTFSTVTGNSSTYNITTSLEGKMTFGSAGWITTNGATATDSTVTIGRVAKATFNNSTATSGVTKNVSASGYNSPTISTTALSAPYIAFGSSASNNNASVKSSGYIEAGTSIGMSNSNSTITYYIPIYTGDFSVDS